MNAETQDALDFLNGERNAGEWVDEPAPWERSTDTASGFEATVLGLLQATSVSDLGLVRKMRETLGRKFEVADLTETGDGGRVLYECASRWIETPEALSHALPFVSDLARKYKQGGGLTDGQAKGILNVMSAQRPTQRPESRPQRTSAPRLEADDDDLNYDAWVLHVLTNVSPGRYTIARPGGHRTYDVGAWKDDDRKPGHKVRFVGLRIGSDQSDYAPCAMQRDDGAYFTIRDYKGDGSVKDDLDIVFDLNPETRPMLREAYCLAARRCARCGRELTHPDSHVRGLGPECAKHVGEYA